MQSESGSASDPGSTLPAELLDLAMERFFSVDGVHREAACNALVAAHPLHATALRRVFGRLRGAEGVLDRTFRAAADDDPGEVGGHRVQRRLGEGAFGVVYLCAQTKPVARQVAVKVLRPGAGDRNTLRRFEAERQLLASLNHPTITHIYDAGHLPDGRPYFVMEYVEGLPISTYCSVKGLDCEDRLRLFVDLCRGVEYAHTRGVVHRDLKPANVLVVDSSTGPQPKIIDFGLAKALSPADRDRAEATDAGRVLGTPGYMSPEQAAGLVELVDERTDVFALGVMLYELLTGELPWPRRAAAADITPQLPSVRISSSARAAGQQGAAARRLAARVRGDLDWITHRATQFEREARYQTVGELAADIERHLWGRPVHAGPPTFGYRLSKLVRRNRAAVLMAGAAVLVAATGLALSAWHARAADAGAARSASDARASFADAAAAVGSLLQRANDETVLRSPQNEAVRQALAADALAFYDKWLRDRPDDPAVRTGRCQALITLSELHYVLGRGDDALRTAEQAGQEAQGLLAAEPQSLARRALLAETDRKRGRALQLLGRRAEAGPCLDRSVQALERCAADAPANHARSWSGALREQGGNELLLGRGDAAMAAFRRSFEVLEDLVARGIGRDEARSELVSARSGLAIALTNAGQFDAADAILAVAEAGLGDVVVDRLRATATVYGWQGRNALRRGDAKAAVPRLVRAVAASETWRQQEPQQLRAIGMLRDNLRDLGEAHDGLADWAAADASMRRAVEVGEEIAARFTGGVRDGEQRGMLFDFARLLWSRFRRQDLVLAEAWVGQAMERDGAATEGRPLRWECLRLQALIGDSDGRATDDLWEHLARVLPKVEELPRREMAPNAVEAWIGVARSRCLRGELAAATAALDATEPFLAADGGHVGKDYRSEIVWWRARIALASGDVAAAAPQLARLLELRPSWWGRWKAGECELAAWQALARSGAPAEQVLAHRTEAAALFRAVVDDLAPKVAADPADPWRVVPWGLASLGLAEIEHDRGELAAARALLDAALPALARVDASAHRDQWDEARMTAARALRERLSGQHQR